MTTERPRVLMVDDDAMVRKAIARMLRRDYDIVEASGVADVARLLASDTAPITAVIIDYQMKDGDGFDALRVVLGKRPELDGRSILFTGSPLDVTLQRQAAAAAMRLVHKSEPVELRRALADVLGRS